MSEDSIHSLWAFKSRVFLFKDDAAADDDDDEPPEYDGAVVVVVVFGSCLTGDASSSLSPTVTQEVA